ncbi:MAG: helix-turn-helix domain-containing protein, partial [Ligilactobacillus ruminis]|nr:helix-turn-helix domain-containing protein [Ligilactobacillus ruminis]
NYDSIQKVADFLLTETNPNEPVIPYTHSDLAGCLNLNRVTVSRIMEEFKAERMVEYGRGTIRVLKRQKLEELLK